MPAITNVYILILAHLEIKTVKYPYAPFPGNKGSLGFILMVYHFHEFYILGYIFFILNLFFNKVCFVSYILYCFNINLTYM